MSRQNILDIVCLKMLIINIPEKMHVDFVENNFFLVFPGAFENFW